MTKQQRKAIEATQKHIQGIVDTTPWAEAARLDWCRTCPGRSGVISESGLESPCYACPLRPLIVALAELQLRQNRDAAAAAAAAAAPNQKGHTTK